MIKKRIFLLTISLSFFTISVSNASLPQNPCNTPTLGNIQPAKALKNCSFGWSFPIPPDIPNYNGFAEMISPKAQICTVTNPLSQSTYFNYAYMLPQTTKGITLCFDTKQSRNYKILPDESIVVHIPACEATYQPETWNNKILFYRTLQNGDIWTPPSLLKGDFNGLLVTCHEID